MARPQDEPVQARTQRQLGALTYYPWSIICSASAVLTLESRAKRFASAGEPYACSITRSTRFGLLGWRLWRRYRGLSYAERDTFKNDFIPALAKGQRMDNNDVLALLGKMGVFSKDRG